MGKRTALQEPVHPAAILRELREAEGMDHPKLRIMRLHFLEGHTHSRISKEEGIALHTVKRCLRKARLVGVHATLKRGWREQSTRNRNYGLSKLDEVYLKARIEEGWVSAKVTQKWFHDLRGGSGPMISIAALYGYRKRLAPNTRVVRKVRREKVRRPPKNRVELLESAIFPSPEAGEAPREWAPMELREMVRSTLGVKKMATHFGRLGATEVSMPPDVMELLDEERVWSKLLGLSVTVPGTGSHERQRVILLERTRRAPRGGSYISSGFVVVGPKMKNQSPDRLRGMLQERFSTVHSRRIRSAGKDNLPDFIVLQTSPVVPQWWLVGTAKWNAIKVTAFENALKIFSVSTEASRHVTEILLASDRRRRGT